MKKYRPKTAITSKYYKFMQIDLAHNLIVITLDTLYSIVW